MFDVECRPWLSTEKVRFTSGLLSDLMRLAVYDISSTAASAVSIVDMHSTDPDVSSLRFFFLLKGAD